MEYHELVKVLKDCKPGDIAAAVIEAHSTSDVEWLTGELLQAGFGQDGNEESDEPETPASE